MVISVHPQNPQYRQLQKITDILHKDGVIAYPTDTLFGIGCDIRCAKALNRIARIQGKEKKMSFSFICGSFSQADQYVKISKEAYRLMKHVLPGPYTFILPATNLVPKKIMHHRKTVGIRIPDNPICREIVNQLGAPLANTSIHTEEGVWAGDGYSVASLFGHQLDAVIDGGVCEPPSSTVIDLSSETPEVIREGKGDISLFI